MRAVIMGLIGMYIIAASIDILDVSMKEEYYQLFLFQVFIVCAVSQLIKQAKEDDGE